MNLQVANGFEFRDPDLGSIMALLQSHHGTVLDLAYAGTLAFLADAVANAIDKSALKGRPPGRPYEDAATRFEERRARVEREGVLDVAVDFSFSVTVLPHEGRALGLVVTQQRAWRDGFLALPGVVPYAYWTGEDRVPGVDDAEWERRRDTWTALVRRDPGLRISASGIVHDFPALMDFPTAEEVAGSLPSLDRRLARYAKEAAIEARVARLDREGVPVAQAVLRAIEWQAGGEGQVETLRAREALRPRLRPVLTLEDVLGEPAASHVAP